MAWNIQEEPQRITCTKLKKHENQKTEKSNIPNTELNFHPQILDTELKGTQT